MERTILVANTSNMPLPLARLPLQVSLCRDPDMGYDMALMPTPPPMAEACARYLDVSRMPARKLPCLLGSAWPGL